MPRLESAAEPTIRRTGRRGRPARVSSSLAEINVVPLVDVMLVLLVIFMVTAPMMQQGFAVNLPQASHAQPINAEPVYVTVPATFRRDGRVQIDDKTIPLDALANQARQALQARATKDLFLRADGAVLYEDFMRVMEILKQGGVQNVGLATQPRQSDKQR
jgi:biopolymer transport protein TolR